LIRYRKTEGTIESVLKRTCGGALRYSARVPEILAVP